jgi:hypothetical protein
VQDAPTPPILVLVRDLLFASKISATAGAQGVPVKLLRDPAKLGGETGHALIVDLNQDGALSAALQWKRQGAGRVIGFVSHVDSETIRAARAGGVDRVLPRSEFVRSLPELLKAV